MKSNKISQSGTEYRTDGQLLNTTCLHLLSDLSFPSPLRLLFHLGMRNYYSYNKTDSHLWEAVI